MTADRADSEQILDAIQRGDVTRLRLLLDESVDPNVVMYGRSLLSWAGLTNDVDIVKALLECSASAKPGRASGSVLDGTPLLTASFTGHLDMVQLLLAHGANPNHADEIGQTPIMAAAKGGHLAVVELLHQHHAVVDAVDSVGRTALHWTCVGGDVLDVARYLVAAGVDPDARTADGARALDYASELGRTALVAFLAESGNVDQRGPDQ